MISTGIKPRGDRDLTANFSTATVASPGLTASSGSGGTYRLGVRGAASTYLDADVSEVDGHMYDIGFRKEGRNLSYGANHFSISPDFKTATGFVSRTNQHQTGVNMNSPLVAAGLDHQSGAARRLLARLHSRRHASGRAARCGLCRCSSRRTSSTTPTSIATWSGAAWINFDKTRYGFGGGVNTSRKISFGGFFNKGDQIRYVENPFLGRRNRVPGVHDGETVHAPAGQHRSEREPPDRAPGRIWRSSTSGSGAFKQPTNSPIGCCCRNIFDYNDYDSDRGRQHSAHVSREFRHGLLRGLRRSIQAGQSDGPDRRFQRAT